MNTEQKAKAYDEALEKMKSWARGEHPECFTEAQKTAEFIFPELKESEDERIKKTLIDYFQTYKEQEECGIKTFFGIPTDNILAWLEKQGEQEKPQVYKTDDGEVITYSESEGYKVIEPKFKVGDWILYSGDHYEGVRHITKINENGYYIERNGLPHGIIPFNHEICMRLWTIQDAKDGDTLVASDGSLFMFAKLKNNSAYYHISLCKNGSMEISDGNHSWETAKGCHPATKEQCDLLFQKMKEAGYEWDTEKKELRKIEDESENYNQQVMSEMANLVKDYIRQKSTWSEEDERMLHTIIADFKGFIRDNTSTLESHFNECIDWLKSIKNKIVK